MARSSLDRWVRLVEENDFKTFSDLRKTFPHADQVGPKTVFNVGGNKVRTITVIQYDVKLVIVEAVLTHAEYDK